MSFTNSSRMMMLACITRWLLAMVEQKSTARSAGNMADFTRKRRDPAYICEHRKFHIFPCADTFMHRTATA